MDKNQLSVLIATKNEEKNRLQKILEDAWIFRSYCATEKGGTTWSGLSTPNMKLTTNAKHTGLLP